MRLRMILSLIFCTIGFACWAQTGRVDLPTPRPLEERAMEEITPAGEFFVISFAGTPKVDSQKWRLSISGMVNRRLNLSLADLNAMKQTEHLVTIECIENPAGGNLIGTGRWSGVLLSDILGRAGVTGSPRNIVFRAADGYEESIPYSLLKNSPVMVVTKLNGKPLPAEQGFPGRLIIPGLYGMKQVKWVQSIELIPGDFQGFWEKKGWSDKAEVFVKSLVFRVDPCPCDAGDLRVRGVAYAGLQKLSKVEVSIDGNPWRPASIEKTIGPYAWSFWFYRWPKPTKGQHTIAVRAFDSAGKTQPMIDNEYRDGNNGIHAVTYNVK